MENPGRGEDVLCVGAGVQEADVVGRGFESGFVGYVDREDGEAVRGDGGVGGEDEVVQVGGGAAGGGDEGVGAAEEEEAREGEGEATGGGADEVEGGGGHGWGGLRGGGRMVSGVVSRGWGDEVMNAGAARDVWGGDHSGRGGML